MQSSSVLELDSTEENLSKTPFETSTKLGKCEVCNYQDAKYTCPKCEVKTCRLECVTIHKKELNCNGIRDRTKFVPVKQMSETDFRSDYQFLEECTRYVNARKCDKIKKYTRFNKQLPARLFALRTAAYQRNIKLQFLLPNFTKHKLNSSYYVIGQKVIYWHIEWIFPNASNIAFTDTRCSECEPLITLLSKYIDCNYQQKEMPTEQQECNDDKNLYKFENKQNNEIIIKKELKYYQCRGIGGITLLLKSEGIKNCKNRFYQLDPMKSLKKNFSGKTIIEYPSIYVVFSEFASEFDVIDSDDDIELETKEYRDELNELCRKVYNKNDLAEEGEGEEDEEVNRQNKLNEMEKVKKNAERLLKRLKRKTEPQNLLFTDESLWDDEDDEDSSSGNDSDV